MNHQLPDKGAVSTKEPFFFSFHYNFFSTCVIIPVFSCHSCDIVHLQQDISGDQQLVEKNVVFTQEPDVIATIHQPGKKFVMQIYFSLIMIKAHNLFNLLLSPFAWTNQY